MACLEPSFRKDPDGSLTLKDSADARSIKNQHRERDWATAKSATVMRKEAEEMAKKVGGDVNNSKHLLGFFELQFGCFRSMRGGPGTVPTSWPNANRYTEAIIIRLLSVLPRIRTRLDDVTKAYYDIRQLGIENGKVMSETRMQLPEISRGTLIQWFTKRGKALDKLVVTQGVRFVKPSQTTSTGVHAAVEKPAQLPTRTAGQHTFQCPTNTAGMARMKGQKRKSHSTPAQPTVPTNASQCPLSTSQSSCSIPAQQYTPVVPVQQSTPVAPVQQSTPVAPVQQSTSVAPVHQSAIPGLIPVKPLQLATLNIDGQSSKLTDVPYTTQRYRKRKLEREKEGIVKRKYERKKTPVCRECGQECKPPTHAQSFMNWFCAVTSGIPFINWKEDMAKKDMAVSQNLKYK